MEDAMWTLYWLGTIKALSMMFLMSFWVFFVLTNYLTWKIINNDCEGHYADVKQCRRFCLSMMLVSFIMNCITPNFVVLNTLIEEAGKCLK